MPRYAETLGICRTSQSNDRQVLPTPILAHIKANASATVAGDRCVRRCAWPHEYFDYAVARPLQAKFQGFHPIADCFSSRDLFTRRWQLLLPSIAFLPAICVNRDAVALFKAYLADEGVRQAVIE
jgi:hypothetical protein